MISICRSSNAGLDCTHRCVGSGGSISECSPHPWSSDTTRPSSGLHLFAHTPNSRFSSPFSGTKNPQVAQVCPPAVLVDSDLGPRGPSYQRLAVWERPRGLITCLRDRSNSSTASSTSDCAVAATSESLPSPDSASGGVGTSSDEATSSLASTAAALSAPSSVCGRSSTGSVRRNPSSSRGSSGSVPIESVTDRSVGSRRSFHGTHSGGRNA